MRHFKSNDIFLCRYIFRPSQTACGVGKECISDNLYYLQLSEQAAYSQTDKKGRTCLV